MGVGIQRRLARPCAVALLIGALGVVGCGDNEGRARAEADKQTPSATVLPTTTTEAAPIDASPAIGVEVLGKWDAVLIPAVLANRDRAVAAEKGDMARAARLDRRFQRYLKRARKFGSRTRAAFVDEPDSRIKGRVTAAADAWTEWANELLTAPPAGDFDQARHIADLAAVAVAKTRRAYRAVGEPIPAAWRRG